MIGEYAGGADDDSGMDISGGGTGIETPFEMDEPIDADTLSINLKVFFLHSKFQLIFLSFLF